MLRRRAGLSHVTLTLPRPRLTLTQKQTDLPMVMLKRCAQPRGTDLWSLVLPRWEKTYIYTLYGCNLQLRVYNRLYHFYSAEICLYYPSSSIVSPFISKHIEHSYQFVSFNLHSSHLDKRQLQESVTRVSYRSVMHIIYPHSCSVYSGEGPVTLTPVTLHYILFI